MTGGLLHRSVNRPLDYNEEVGYEFLPQEKANRYGGQSEKQ